MKYITPTLTALKSKTEIDVQSCLKHYDFLINAGIDGVAIFGSSGEFPHLSVEERKSLISAAIKHIDRRMQVLIGTGDMRVEECVAMSNFAFEQGADGTMRRDAMRELVFRLPEARRKLENIIHPIVLQQAQELGEAAQRQGRTVILYEIPLLAESPHWRKRLDRIIVVDCDEDTQIQRATQRSALTWETASSIVASQAGRQDRWRIADAVIFNGSAVDPQQLRDQVRILARSFGLMIAAGESPSDPVRTSFQ